VRGGGGVVAGRGEGGKKGGVGRRERIGRKERGMGWEEGEERGGFPCPSLSKGEVSNLGLNLRNVRKIPSRRHSNTKYICHREIFSQIVLYNSRAG
jgi:hypothetical protein